MQQATVPTFVGDDESAQSVTAVGFSFSVVAKNQPIQSKTATLTIIGNETGGSVTIQLSVRRATAVTANFNPR